MFSFSFISNVRTA